MPKITDHVRGLLLALGGIFILSPDGLLIKLITTDDWTLLFWRGLLTSISLLFALIFFFKKPLYPAFQNLGKTGLFVATIQAMGTAFFVLAIIHTTVANTLIIIGVTPLWAAIYSRIFLKEHIHLRTYLAIPAALLGIYITTNVEIETNIGDLYALCATLFIAAQGVIVRSAKTVDLTPSLVIGGLIIALVAWPNAHPLAITQSDLLYLGILGVIVLPASYILLIAAPRYIPAPEVNLIMLLEIVLGSLWVWVFLAKQPTQQAFIGGGIVIITLAIHTYLGFRANKTT
ncbi:MAG: drug/metabolite transporter (DMT)-like permease [Candidatus Latescibacterota bacterium]